MSTVADCLGDRVDDDAVAFQAMGQSLAHAWGTVVEASWKAGHLFRHHGIHAESTVAVVVGPGQPNGATTVGRLKATPEPLFGLLGALSVGATVEIEPARSVTAAALLAPAAWQNRFDVPPGCTRFAYGGVPEHAATIHFERARWSENAVAPPEAIPPNARAVPGRTQSEILERAREVVSTHGLTTDDSVTASGRLTAAALAGAVIAPLLVGATILSGGGPGDLCVGEDGAVSSNDRPGTRRV